MEPVTIGEAQQVVAEDGCFLLFRVGDDFYPCVDAKAVQTFLSDRNPIPYPQKQIVWQRGHGWRENFDEPPVEVVQPIRVVFVAGQPVAARFPDSFKAPKPRRRMQKMMEISKPRKAKGFF